MHAKGTVMHNKMDPLGDWIIGDSLGWWIISNINNFSRIVPACCSIYKVREVLLAHSCIRGGKYLHANFVERILEK